MNSIGFLTLNLKHEEAYFTEIAARAKKYQFRCYRFIPSNINPATELVEGEWFDHDKTAWIKGSFPLPDILYDRCFYGEDYHSKQCMSIVNWLKTKGNIRFLGFGLPNKLELYRVLSGSKLAPYLPFTEEAGSPKTILKWLQKKKRIILKPINGFQGNGIYLLEIIKDSIQVRTDKKEKQVSYTFSEQAVFRAWLERILAKREFLIQPYLPLTNDCQRPFDIRSLLQKTDNGKWAVIGKGVRVGKEGGIISNLSAGASVLNFNSWLEKLPRTSKDYIRNEVEEILNMLPAILESTFPPLFELGVDIGLAKDGSLWILDVNSKPGRKLLSIDQPEKMEYLYGAPLRYALSLKERSQP